MPFINPYHLFPETTTELPKKVFFLVPNLSGGAARDSEIKTLLEGDGWTVDYKEEQDLTAPSDLDGYGVLLISHGVNEGHVTDPDAALGVDIGVVWIGRRLDTDLDVEDLVNTSSRNSIYVDNVSHPITSFLGSTGSYRVYTNSTPLSSNSAAGGTVLARFDSGSGDPVLWVYEKGDARVTSGTYGGRRVITWIQGLGGERIDYSPDFYGQTLLLRAMEWATYRL